MKLCYFDDFRLGVVKGDNVVDITATVASIPNRDSRDLIVGLIERWDEFKPQIDKVVAAETGKPLKNVRLRAPVPRPGACICMAVNYMENGTLKQKPDISAFTKGPSAIIGDHDTMILPDVGATIFEGEAELAVVIGKKATNVTEADAMNYVFGYTGLIDGSARGILPQGANRFLGMKSRDTFGPIGPFLVTADEISDPHKLDIKLTNNGELKQELNTDDMAHQIPRCIEWVSSIQTLEPGDILATGTNHQGLHSYQDGDEIAMTIEKIGTLHINVKDELKRTWARTTRHEWHEAHGEGPHTPQISGKYAKV